MINDFYLRAADLPADTRSLVTEWIEAHPRRLQWAVRRTRQYFGYLDHCNDLTRLAVVLAMLPDTHEKYRQLGIEDTVFAETMSDIGIWCANCGGGGLHNVHWIKIIWTPICFAWGGCNSSCIGCRRWLHIPIPRR